MKGIVMCVTRISTSIVLAATAFLLSSCAVGPQAMDASAPSAVASCPKDARLAGSMALSAVDVSSSLSLSPSLPGDSLSIVSALAVTGPCVGLAQSYGATGIVTFSNGAAVTLNGSPRISDGRNGEAFFAKYKAISADDQHPAYENLAFVMATAVSKRFAPDGKVIADNYAGIWRKGDMSVVASFSKSSDGSFTEPRVLLKSSLPLKSITYFPNPDSPAGSLGLIQERGKKITLISLHWSHPSLANVGK